MDIGFLVSQFFIDMTQDAQGIATLLGGIIGIVVAVIIIRKVISK